MKDTTWGGMNRRFKHGLLELLGTGRIIFNLKTLMPIDGQNGPIINLYDEIKAGRKTSEWREVTSHWVSRLIKNPELVENLFSQETRERALKMNMPLELTKFTKVTTAWFVRGYPKGNLPRLEANITGLYLWQDKASKGRFQITFENVKEVTECSQKVV